SIDSVMDKKLDALAVMESQFLEGGANGNEKLAGTTPEQRKRRAEQVRLNFSNRYRGIAERYRKELADWYGKDAAEKVKFAEAFEICESGQKPGKEQLPKLFPFFTPTAAAANRRTNLRPCLLRCRPRMS